MDKNAKTIAVVVRERQDEALRMGLGITLCDDTIDIYVLDRKIEESEKNTRNLEVMEELEMDVFTNCNDNEKLKYLSTEEIAVKLLTYDSSILY